MNYIWKRNPINAKFFDMNSNNTFNQLWTLFDERKTEHNFPPWLRLPSHYLGNVWNRVKSVEDYLVHNDNRLFYELECGHSVAIDRKTIQMRTNQVKMIVVNCSKCGGTGEVRIV